MTIFKSITRSQSLLQEIATTKQCSENNELTTLISSLTIELDNINALAQQLSKGSSNVQASVSSKPEIQSGCYVFTDVKGFFCPNCYDNHDNKVATTRINKKLRVCPACRTSIK